MTWLHEVAATQPYAGKTTEAPQYRRVGRQLAEVDPSSTDEHGIIAGDGFAFVFHTGDVYPSGFLPLSAGSVRASSVSEIYRESALFRSPRDRDNLVGKCGACPYRLGCGGSRSRAFATTGDPFASDPLYPYVPPLRENRRQASRRRSVPGPLGRGGTTCMTRSALGNVRSDRQAEADARSVRGEPNSPPVTDRDHSHRVSRLVIRLSEQAEGGPRLRVENRRNVQPLLVLIGKIVRDVPSRYVAESGTLQLGTRRRRAGYVPLHFDARFEPIRVRPAPRSRPRRNEESTTGAQNAFEFVVN